MARRQSIGGLESMGLLLNLPEKVRFVFMSGSNWIYLLFLIPGVSVLFQQCKTFNPEGVLIPEQPFEKLSEYHFFVGLLSDLKPNDRVLPYDLNTPLFSDYAEKARFVWMPEETSALYTTDHVLDFPLGTALIKNFYYPIDERDPSLGRRILETRLLINRGEEWDAYGYIWNEEETDAYYDVLGDIKEVKWTNAAGEEMHLDYIIPNKNQCKSCHAYDNRQMPIGPKVRNLNKEFTYVDGTYNQLDRWMEAGYLNQVPSNNAHPSVAQWNRPETHELHDRAMAYLDINCGHCHNPKGAANTSGLTLLAEAPMDYSLGIYKATVSAGAGTGGHTYNIVPGQPEKSIMIYRMQSDNPGAMMPEVGRRLIHKEGVQLIAEWIANMDMELLKPEKVKTLN